MKDTQFIEDLRDILEKLYDERKLNLVEKTNLRLSLLNNFSDVNMNEDTRKRTHGKVSGNKVI